MESLGYVVTNRFILIAVDKNLEISIGEGGEKLNMQIGNARKVYKVSEETAISVIGLPHKITDIYKFILGIQNSKKAFDDVEEDLHSIFNSNLQKTVESLQKVATLIPKFNDENGVLKEAELFKHLENEPDLLQIAKESISLLQSQTQIPTLVCLFGRENDSNVFGLYYSIGFNLVGNKQSTIPEDNIFVGIKSIKASQEHSKDLESTFISNIKSHLISGWKKNEQLEKNLYNACKEELKSRLTSLTPYKMTPEIIFYELNEKSNWIFVEPNDKLIDVTFNRN